MPDHPGKGEKSHLKTMLPIMPFLADLDIT